MFYAVISNHGMGIFNDPAEVGGGIDCHPVTEMRSFFTLPEAYRFACIAFSKRRFQLGVCQPISLPRMEEFTLKGDFFGYDDMISPYARESAGIPYIRFFAYYSSSCLGIFTSGRMVAAALKQDVCPAIVLEFNSIASAQKMIFSWQRIIMEAVSAYMCQRVYLPKGVCLAENIVYPNPVTRLHPVGQELWGGFLMQAIPDVDHTPREVMQFLPPKK